jgi:[ribosomal protein S5]-alanine N-acetyltransferase
MSSFEPERTIPLDFTIITARCRLRCPSAADIPDIFLATRFAGFNDGMQWEPPDSIDELDQPLHDNLADWAAGTTYCLTIADPTTDRLIGRIGIRRTNAGKQNRSERTNVWNLGFWTHPKYQGQGYMTEAAIAVIEFGFETLGATRIEASYALWNKASQRTLEKVGMRIVRYIPHAFQKKGRWIEANKMEITKQEWLKLNSAQHNR